MKPLNEKYSINLYFKDQLDVTVNNNRHGYDKDANKNGYIVADYIEASLGPLNTTAG